MNGRNMSMNGFEISQILIDWYLENKRDLPWRNTTDPYIIWVSEIILQQTRVEQGLDYFSNFIKQFSTIKALANANEDAVMKSWQGLGYYSRARNMHFTAKDIVQRFNGVFPQRYQEIISLKGIGEYTAAAIASFAFNAPYAVVDGNVFRVLARLFAIGTPINTGSGKKIFYSLAQELLNPSFAGLHNQAIMEFGALHCTPHSPACFSCPLNEKCLAYFQQKVKQFPVKTAKTKAKDRYFHYFYVTDGENVFLKKRTGNDIWKNLYEFPLIETASQKSFEELVLLSEFKELFPDSEINSFHQETYRTKHILSHQIIHAVFYKVELIAKKYYLFKNYKKIPLKSLQNYAVPRLIHKYLENLQ